MEQCRNNFFKKWQLNQCARIYVISVVLESKSSFFVVDKNTISLLFNNYSTNIQEHNYFESPWGHYCHCCVDHCLNGIQWLTGSVLKVLPSVVPTQGWGMSTWYCKLLCLPGTVRFSVYLVLWASLSTWYCKLLCLPGMVTGYGLWQHKQLLQKYLRRRH